ncbi:caspase family protein [Azospirillum rugosum]|uniref:Peptidase C14 caspase domain-containing protein n=1 Tax=Azospirillum rugosum TaxID=416170 RepID=A0ABS4SR21_9PROT|nr:caspase family protein [Azospirillum rugosum]MBP2294999.1 hypothetical protein [Azospirillum rugosum]MDQ0528822.1 hypothetical protein [Azospirillum rugosum]
MPVAQPDDHAIVVGINRYHPDFPALQGAVNDATLFHAWLIDPLGGGLNPDHARLICSDPAAAVGNLKPIRDEIEDELVKFYMKKNDIAYIGKPVGRRLYLYFSGHGVTPQQPSYEDCALLMANSIPLMLRALPGRLTYEVLRKAPLFREVVLFMDCCREVAGAVKADTNLPPGDPTAGPQANGLYGFAARWGAQTAERELPHPLDPKEPPLWQGVFTHTLLKGLTTATDEDGQITADSLKSFIRRAVQDLLPPENNQRPEINYDDSFGPIVFGVGRPVEVRVSLTPPTVGFRVLNGKGLANLNPAVETVGENRFTVKLRPAGYVFEGLAGDGSPTRSATVKLLMEGADVSL